MQSDPVAQASCLLHDPQSTVAALLVTFEEEEHAVQGGLVNRIERAFEDSLKGTNGMRRKEN